MNVANKLTETKEQVLIRRVFKFIHESHFNDHKMVPNYVRLVKFPRGLGDDISNYVQGRNPSYYHKLRKQVEAQ